MIRSLTVLFLALILTTPSKSEAQTTDLGRIEYTYFPQSNSDNSFRRFRALVNAPLKVSENDAFVVLGLEYRNINLKYEDTAPFTTGNLEHFQSYEFTLGYTFKLKNNWRFGAKAGTLIASNFTDGIDSSDYLFTSGVYFIKDVDMEDQASIKNWRLIIGLQYSTTAGRPFPLPFVNYNVQVSDKWSYTLGVPKTNVKYYFDPKNIVQTFVTLDGFYANIQDDKVFADGSENVAESISYTVLLAGLGYEHYFTDHLLFYFYGGHTVLNDIRLRNQDKDNIYTVNDTNSFYMRGGIKFKL